MKTRYLPALSLLLGGCLYSNIHSPRAYRSATPLDVKATPADPVVSGEACAQSWLYLIAWGNAGYAAATRKALADGPDSILYDVKTDLRVHSYLLGLYTQVCTIVTGKVGRP